MAPVDGDVSERVPLLGDSASINEDGKGRRKHKDNPLVVLGTGQPAEVEEVAGSPPAENRMRDIIIMSLSFLLMFAAYNTLQNCVTSLLPGKLGNESLGVLYASVPIFVFTAPILVRKWGEKLTMLVGGLCYVVYEVSLIKISFQFPSKIF